MSTQLPEIAVAVSETSLTPVERAFAVYSAKRMVRVGRAKREETRAFCAEHGLDIVTVTRLTDEQFEEHFALAESVVADHGHLYDDNGELLPVLS